MARVMTQVERKSEAARPWPAWRYGLIALGGGPLLYASGFAAFVSGLPNPTTTKAVKADAIVALTGDGDRLSPAVTLLEAGNGGRLLITGVNKLTTKHELKVLLHGGFSFDCCADLGFAAADTRGNAEETARWASEHHYASLIVVTAAYHMPRSLLEFGVEMPGVKLVPYPVAAEQKGATAWQNARRLHGEYVKYLASLMRISADGLMRDA